MVSEWEELDGVETYTAYKYDVETGLYTDRGQWVSRVAVAVVLIHIYWQCLEYCSHIVPVNSRAWGLTHIRTSVLAIWRVFDGFFGLSYFIGHSGDSGGFRFRSRFADFPLSRYCQWSLLSTVQSRRVQSSLGYQSSCLCQAECCKATDSMEWEVVATWSHTHSLFHFNVIEYEGNSFGWPSDIWNCQFICVLWVIKWLEAGGLTVLLMAAPSQIVLCHIFSLVKWAVALKSSFNLRRQIAALHVSDSITPMVMSVRKLDLMLVTRCPHSMWSCRMKAWRFTPRYG